MTTFSELDRVAGFASVSLGCGVQPAPLPFKVAGLGSQNHSQVRFIQAVIKDLRSRDLLLHCTSRHLADARVQFKLVLGALGMHYPAAR